MEQKAYVVAAIAALAVLGIFALLSGGPAKAGTASSNVASGAAIAPVEGTPLVVTKGSTVPASVAGTTSGTTKTLVASIDGMTCGGCVARIKGSVGALDGVKSVDVSLSSKSGTIVYDPSVVGKQKILDAITASGYPATEASGTPSSAQASAGGSTCSGSGGGCGCGCGG